MACLLSVDILISQYDRGAVFEKMFQHFQFKIFCKFNSSLTFWHKIDFDPRKKLFQFSFVGISIPSMTLARVLKNALKFSQSHTKHRGHVTVSSLVYLL